MIKLKVSVLALIITLDSMWNHLGFYKVLLQTLEYTNFFFFFRTLWKKRGSSSDLSAWNGFSNLVRLMGLCHPCMELKSWISVPCPNLLPAPLALVLLAPATPSFGLTLRLPIRLYCFPSSD